MINEDYITDYLNYLKIDRKYEKNTLMSYENDLKKFNKYLNNKSIVKVEKKDIINFLNLERKNNIDRIAHVFPFIR